MKRHLEDQIVDVLLARLNHRRYRVETKFWLIYLAVWTVLVLAVYFLLVETDLIIQP